MWQPIDNDLIDAAGQAFAVENAANSYTVKLPEDASADPVKVVDGGHSVSFSMAGLEGDPSVDGAIATYEVSDDAEATAAEVTYEATGQGVKESIILDKAPAEPVVYEFELEMSAGLSPELRATGEIEILDSNNRVAFTMPAPFMTDANEALSTAVTYDLEQSTGRGWSLSVTPDLAWLQSTDRAYPVVVDPTLNTSPTSDAWIREEEPTTNSSTGAHMRVGGIAGRQRRALLKFDVSNLPATATVDSASLDLYVDSTQTTGSGNHDFTARRVSEAWNDSAVTWNKRTASQTWSTPGGVWNSSSPVVNMNGGTSGYRSFEVDGIVKSWVNNGVANHGFLVKQNEASDRVIWFRSVDNATNQPRLKIQYSLLSNSDAPVIGIEPSAGTTINDVDSVLASALSPVDIVTQVRNGDDWLTIGTTWNPGDDLSSVVQGVFDKVAADPDNSTATLGMFQTGLTNGDLAVVGLQSSGSDEDVLLPLSDGPSVDLASVADDNVLSPSDDGLSTPADPDDANQGNLEDPDYSAAPITLDGTLVGDTESADAACNPNGWFSPRSRMIKGYLYWSTPDYRSGYIGLRLTWTKKHLANLKCQRSNVTYEHDFKTNNYDNKHMFKKGGAADWASNLPNAYRDTTFGDGDDELYYTIGTSDALKLKAGKLYRIRMWTDPGNSETDTAALYGQRGHRSPSICHSTWCIFSDGSSNKIVKAWKISLPKGVPGTVETGG